MQNNQSPPAIETAKRLFVRLRKRFSRLTKIKSKGLSLSEIKTLVDRADYLAVIIALQKNQISCFEQAKGLIGYCFYQVARYEDAIPLLKEALRDSPNDFFSSFFLATSLRNSGDPLSATLQYLDCLQAHRQQAAQILDQMLPLLNFDGFVNNGLTADVRTNIFSRAIELVSPLENSEIHLAKIFFYQHDDKRLSSTIPKDIQFSRFFSALQISQMGIGTYFPLGAPEKLRFIHLNSGAEDWVDTSIPYICELPNAQVRGGSSLVLLEDKILSDVLANKDFGKFVDTKYDPLILARRKDALLIRKPTSCEFLDKGILLSGFASSAYGHWFAEFLPKLRFLESLPAFNKIPIIVDSEMPISHFDFLSLLVDNPIYKLKKDAWLRVGTLFIAPTDTFFPFSLIPGHQVPPTQQSSLTVGALKYLGNRILSKIGPLQSPKERIFLSRKNSTWRKLLNELEIIGELERQGFKTVYIEEYPFVEQVKIFQQASVIVAPNGSATNNIIFSDKNVRVLLLGQKNVFNWGGWFGSFKELGYNLEYLAGESEGNKDEKHLDYTISIEKLKDWLSSL